MIIDGNNLPQGPNQGVHLVWGTPTVTLPTSGTATYTSMGGTAPTVADGSLPGKFYFCIVIDFGTQVVSAAVDFEINETTFMRAYSMSGNGTIVAEIRSRYPIPL